MRRISTLLAAAFLTAAPLVPTSAAAADSTPLPGLGWGTCQPAAPATPILPLPHAPAAPQAPAVPKAPDMPTKPALPHAPQGSQLPKGCPSG
jgi:hypothetical protein